MQEGDISWLMATARTKRDIRLLTGDPTIVANEGRARRMLDR